MSLAAFNAAGYAPVPLRGGRPAVAGIFANNPTWRYRAAEGTRFADCTVGLLCSARPLSGASGPATLGAVSSTWIAGLRVVSPHKKLRAELAAIIERIAGAAPCRSDGNELLYVFKVARPFVPRRVAPVTLPGDNPARFDYVPTRCEVLSAGAFCAISGGTWRNGSLPAVRRDALPALTVEQANATVSEVEQLLQSKGAEPWL
jgi:hypothetical protein